MRRPEGIAHPKGRVEERSASSQVADGGADRSDSENGRMTTAEVVCHNAERCDKGVLADG